jgi:hypothetical protein
VASASGDFAGYVGRIELSCPGVEVLSTTIGGSRTTFVRIGASSTRSRRSKLRSTGIAEVHRLSP